MEKKIIGWKNGKKKVCMFGGGGMSLQINQYHPLTTKKDKIDSCC